MATSFPYTKTIHVVAATTATTTTAMSAQYVATVRAPYSNNKHPENKFICMNCACQGVCVCEADWMENGIVRFGLS